MSDLTFLARVAATLDFVLSPLAEWLARADEKAASALGGDEDATADSRPVDPWGAGWSR